MSQRFLWITRLANISIVVDLYVPRYCSEFKFTSSNDIFMWAKTIFVANNQNFIIVKLDYSLVKQHYFFIFLSSSWKHGHSISKYSLSKCQSNWQCFLTENRAVIVVVVKYHLFYHDGGVCYFAHKEHLPEQ